MNELSVPTLKFSYILQTDCATVSRDISPNNDLLATEIPETASAKVSSTYIFSTCNDDTRSFPDFC